MSANQKPFFVVIDTNIWIQDSSLLLNTFMGSALRYILRQSNGKIGLPEIIEEELTRHTVRKGIEAIEAINKNFKTFGIIMGHRPFYEEPDKAKLEAAVKQRLRELDDLIFRIDFTFEHAKSALRRINEYSQPNGENNQQFKDSAVWESILTLLSSHTDTVHFITDDGGFFKNRQRDSGALATNLLKDAQKLRGVVHIHKNIASCVKLLQENVPAPDYLKVISEIDKVINSSLERKSLLAEVGVEIIDVATEISSISVFLTEINDRLALSFDICYHCTDVQNTDNNEKKEIVLRTLGICLYQFDTKQISDLTLDSERIYEVEPSGKESLLGSCVYGSTNISNTGGSEDVKYTLREPVNFIRFSDLDRKK